MVSSGEPKLNIFEIDENYIDKLKSQSSVFVYEIFPEGNTTIEKKDIEIIERISKGTTSRDDNTKKLFLYSIFQINENYLKKIREKVRKEIKLEYIGKKKINDLSDNDKSGRNLLKKLLKNQLEEKIFEIINDLKIIREIEKRYESIKDFFVLFQTISSIRIIEDDANKLYASFDIKSQIFVRKNLWSLVDRNFDSLKKLETLSRSIYFVYIPHYFNYFARRKVKPLRLKKVYTKTEYEERIKSSIGYSYYELLDYSSKVYNMDVEEFLSIFDDKKTLDKEQPIIESTDGFFYPVQLCLPIYTRNLTKIFDDKDGDKIKKFRIIEKIIREVSMNKEKIFDEILDKLNGILKKHYYSKVNYLKDIEKIKLKIITKSNGEVEVKNTSDISKYLKNKDIIPINIPKDLYSKRIIKVYFFIYDKLLKNSRTLEIVKSMVKDIKEKVISIFEAIVNNKIEEENKVKIEIEEQLKPISNFENEIDNIKKENAEKEIFVFIIGSEKVIGTKEDYYEEIKKALIENGIATSQNMLIEKYENIRNRNPKELNYMMNNILYDMFSKFGIKIFSLNTTLNYDYVIGIDIGRNYELSTDIIGCITIFSKKSNEFQILPISIPTKQYSEKVVYKEIFRKLNRHLNLMGKKILILRDGNIRFEEIEDLKNISEKYKIRIDLIGIKKSIPIRDLANSHKVFYLNYLREDSRRYYLLKLHFINRILPARLIELTQVVEIEGKNVNNRELNEKDLLVLYSLSIFNLSSLSKSALKLPSPLYYADKFVKALGKGWEVRDENKLKDGMLYFI